MKALGVGLWAFDLRDVSVVGGRGGVPALVVVGRAEQCARTRGVSEWRLSLTHTRGCAGAVVVALG
jgi:holo-[acyl-carrier protein] synthase